MNTAHLDTAGSGRMPAAVRAVLADATARDDLYGPYDLEERLGAVLHTEVYARLGGLLGVPAADTALFTGAAAAFDSCVAGLAPALGPGHRIWTTPYEGVARLTTLYALRDRTHCTLEVVPLRADGGLDLEWMGAHLDEDVALVSVTHVAATLGTVSPVEAVGRLLAGHRAVYAVDASHSVGRLPVDATAIGCDLLTADGWRFLRGPDSIGFAYVAPALRSALTGHAHPQPHPAAVAALNEALAHHAAAELLPRRDLQTELRAVLERTPGIELLTPDAPAGPDAPGAPEREQSGILAFRHADLPAALIRRGLARRGVVVWKTVGQETPLHLPARGVTTALRASVHYDNTPEDIARFDEALQDVLAELREELRARDEQNAPVRLLAPAASGPATPTRAPARRGHLTLVAG
ncbi:aminotransferase class V-fold PLP-dependent enzyme (plasmid) [Streptomyces sp. NBC_00536]|uniref:aminotransferase class V-fold PLP-dependent enzyme n=1 Tax=Streptomyces sp. NBC_00536 TaxID=2975769 RepID=UPI002E7FC52B|nr:aminotransferase class V-fold PLP-dependent enzyme [Streptomyces sp. NBC_00536]WUC84210.1 aminotransferase class V-fold PLP-dependent enzyme [Streptomyces sp. NBC_00536]